MNSFEDGVGIVFDTARYPELWRSKSSNFNSDAALHRWRIDLGEGTVSEESLDDRAIEFPRVHENLVGLPTRYGYAVATFGEQNSLVKYDLLTGGSTTHVYDKPTDSSSFVVLDASDIAAPPVASVRLPQRVPFGFHGSWLPD